MTDRLKAMFERHYNDSIQHSHHVNYYNPAEIMDADTITLRDQWSADELRRLTEEIELLKEYRAALAERYNELLTAPTVPVVRLRRHKEYYRDNKVYYYLEEITRFIDRPNSRDKTTYTDQVVNCTTFAGIARRDAIKAFETYKKNHPGIIAILDIEKGSWER